MKRTLSLLLVLALLVALTACGEKAEKADGTTTTTTAGEIKNTITENDATTTTVGGSTTTTKKPNSTTTSGKTTRPQKQTDAVKPSESTTKAPAFQEPQFPEYYELSRKTSASVTIESMFRKLCAASEDVAGFSGDIPENENESAYAIYSADGSASQLQHMDIFGYNLTLDDLLGSNWGGVDFYSELVGPDMKVNFKSANGHALLPLKNKDDILPLLKSDVAKVKAFLGNKAGVPSINVDYTSHVGSFDKITEDMLARAAGLNNNTLHITVTDLKVDGKTFNMSFDFTSRMFEEKPCYYFSVGIHTIR